MICIRVLITFFGLSSVAAAQTAFPRPSTIPPSATVEPTQDFSEVVVPISSLRIAPSAKLGLSGALEPKLNIHEDLGTGFCLDATCRFIATNYHVAMMARSDKIKGQRIIQRYLATGPHDEGATANLLPNGDMLPYAKKRDLAVFELRHSLPRHHGLTLSLDELKAGQEVDIYGYPMGINPFRKLTRFPATFKAPTTSGLLAFEYQLPADKPIRIRGASGGIVVDRKTEKIVGVLSETTETMALAVPVHALADFVSKVQPFLAQKIFSSIMEVLPISADLYPKLAPASDFYPRFVPLHLDGLQQRPEETYEVRSLRQKSQLLADSMRNFIAVQSYAWGSGDKDPEAEAWYQVRVIDGEQRFREYPDGKKELKQVPYPRLNGWTLAADEWSQLPKMVGTEYRLKVRESPEVVVHGQRMKVFQYYSSIEDNLCPFVPVEDFGLFTISKAVAVACYGEVWTDEDTNILRISENLDLSDKLKAYRGWENYRILLTYGWLNRPDEPSRLVPVTIYTEARNGKQVYWCRGQFTNYQEFTVKARLLAD